MIRGRGTAAALFSALVGLGAFAAAADGPRGRAADATVLVRGATVWTQGPQGRIDGADLLVRDGKIVRVGVGLEPPSGAVIVDAAGKHVTPGLIDCHSHTAIRGGVNEGSNNVTAEVRVRDALDPWDENIYRELAGGLTAAHSLHGSANTIGGQDAVIKLRWPADSETMVLAAAPAGIKFALGENPKRSNFRSPGGTPRFPATRMGVLESVRESFLAAREYREQWSRYAALSKREQERREPPRRDLQLEAVAEILEGTRRVHSHSYRQDEILALLRLLEDFDVRIATFQHVLEGYKVADELAAHGAGASTFSDWWAYKLEAYDATPYNGALLHERGVLVSFNSDSDELARRLNLEAAKAVKYGGLPEEDALDFVTRNAARQLGVEARIGSLAPGMDADFVIWSGHPLSVYSVAEQTWVDGRAEFDRATDDRRRAEIERLRAERIDTIRGGAAKAAASSAATPQPPATPNRYVDPPIPSAGVVSIVHGTVHTLGPAGTIRDGTVSFRDGRIVEVGPSLPPLPGATVVDAKDRNVYPGMIAALSAVGLTEIGSVAGSVDLAETGRIHPQMHTAYAVNPDSELIPVTRANGLTHVVTAPSGGLVSGTSTLLRLSGWTWEDLAASGPVAMHVRWPEFRTRRGPEAPTEEDQKKEREKALTEIRDLFDAARAYARSKQAARSDFEVDPGLEAMLAVLSGAVPVIVHADEVRQIRSALAWGSEQQIRMILAGAGDTWRVADELKRRDVPVIVTSVLRLPEREDEPYDIAYSIPARLHEAGVRFCISIADGGFDAANARNLPYHAAMAAAFGLPKDEALAAVTRSPAQILGFGAALGTLEPGKSASLVVADGDLLEIRTRVLAEYMNGRQVPLDDNRHERLYRKYRSRPVVVKEAE